MSKKQLTSEFADLIEMQIVDYVNRCPLDDLLEIGKIVLGENHPAVQGLEKELDNG